MTDIVVAGAVVRPDVEQVRWKSGAVPITAGLIQSVRPGVAHNVRHTVPRTLGESDLQSVVVTEVLIRNVIDVREIWELAEVRPFEVLARGAARTRRSDDLRRRERSIARCSGRARQPTGTGKWCVDVAESECVLKAQVPRAGVRPAKVGSDCSNRARLVIRGGVQWRVAADHAGTREDRIGDAPIYAGCVLNAGRGNVAGSLDAVQQSPGRNRIDAKSADSLLRHKHVEALDHLNDAAGAAQHPLRVAFHVPGKTYARGEVVSALPKRVDAVAQLHQSRGRIRIKIP